MLSANSCTCIRSSKHFHQDVQTRPAVVPEHESRVVCLVLITSGNASSNKRIDCNLCHREQTMRISQLLTAQYGQGYYVRFPPILASAATCITSMPHMALLLKLRHEIAACIQIPALLFSSSSSSSMHFFVPGKWLHCTKSVIMVQHNVHVELVRNCHSNRRRTQSFIQANHTS